MKPLDLTRYRKELSKNINLSFGFNDPKTWISTGNYALNYRISSDFNRGIPLGKVTIFAGQPGAGKSFIASGNIVREAQKQGIFCVLIDTENALDEEWLKALGVDTSQAKLMRVSATFVDDVAQIISTFMKGYIDCYKDEAPEDRPKVLFVIDSLSMLMTPTEADQFEKGDMKGDMGRLPRQLKALVKNCVNMFGQYDIGLICTNHTYASQDMFDPDDKISGGQGIVYAASIVVAIQRRKLKEDLQGKKTTDVRGIKAAVKVMKSRYAKPFESIDVHIAWDTGMNAYSGLDDMFEAMGILQKDGNKLKYTAKDGTEHKYFRHQFPDEVLNLVMDEFEEREIATGVGTEKEAETEDEQ